MKRVSAICLLLFLLSACKKDKINLPDPPDEYPEWTTFATSNSGITDNQVNALAIDRNDTKWIGTSKGLVRFQQNEWTIFDQSNSPLPSSYIQSLAVENDGTVWAGTAQGLARYSQGNWKIYTTANSELTYAGVLSLAHDAQRKLTYAGTEGSTIRINQQGKLELLEDSGNPVFSMAVDKNGIMWSGSFNFFAFMGRIRKFANGHFSGINLPEKGYPSAFPYAITIDHNNKALVTLTGTSVRSVVRIDGNELAEVPYSKDAAGFKAILTQNDKVWV
ncbi:MAG: hypothetical protein EOO01_44550, partial [Chitinophagaceae bacterium]